MPELAPRQPAANPSAPSSPSPAAPPVATDEKQLAQWQEPLLDTSADAPSLPLIIAGCVLVTGVSIATAILLHDSTYYFAAVAAVAFGFSLAVQRRKTAPSRPVTLTTARIQIGKKEHLLADMAGFWTRSEHGVTIINIEPKKVSSFPVSVLFSETEDQARGLMLNALPEVEPRQTDITDQLGRYIKF